MTGALWNLLTFLLAIGILISVHEFGHFWVARRCGIKVERFSLGFGKVLWQTVDKQGTEFSLSLIPLGGYVKMLDERVAPVPEALRHQAFNTKPVWQRAAVVAAGPVANFLFAIFAYWIVFLVGIPSVHPVVGQVTPNSIAARSGITAGMELKSIAGIETPDWESVNLALVSLIGDKQAQVDVSQFGTQIVQNKALQLDGWHFEPDKETAFGALGIIPKGPDVLPIVTSVGAGSAAEQAGLVLGDRITAINGQPLTQWSEFVKAVQESPDKALSLTVERAGQTQTLTLTPQTHEMADGKSVGYAGVAPKVLPLPPEYSFVRQFGIIDSVVKATQKTMQLSTLTLDMLGKLFTGDVGIKSLSGPISIAKGAGMTADFGFIFYLGFLALISVNLGIINLFPLPVLDGGHLLFLAIEGLTGKPLSEKVQEYSFRFGTVLLVLLMGVALFNDFSRL
ncbi:MAG: sigma E protease regulator RseP [Plesiomonas sp.]|uniref:sigma E protease regulator RseP n=1 Tax=Plesiomonas sp. TaxID=2486279 RepID=UPI003F2F8AFF